MTTLRDSSPLDSIWRWQTMTDHAPLTKLYQVCRIPSKHQSQAAPRHFKVFEGVHGMNLPPLGGLGDFRAVAVHWSSPIRKLQSLACRVSILEGHRCQMYRSQYVRAWHLTCRFHFTISHFGAGPAVLFRYVIADCCITIEKPAAFGSQEPGSVCAGTASW